MGHIWIFVDYKKHPFLFCQLKNIFQRRLKGCERICRLNAVCAFQNAPAEVLKVLLGIALYPHKIDGFFLLDKLG